MQRSLVGREHRDALTIEMTVSGNARRLAGLYLHLHPEKDF
jgi:hypothetical protein